VQLRAFLLVGIVLQEQSVNQLVDFVRHTFLRDVATALAQFGDGVYDATRPLVLCFAPLYEMVFGTLF
jgi:hypothetical protein